MTNTLARAKSVENELRYLIWQLISRRGIPCADYKNSPRAWLDTRRKDETITELVRLTAKIEVLHYEVSTGRKTGIDELLQITNGAKQEIQQIYSSSKFFNL